MARSPPRRRHPDDYPRDRHDDRNRRRSHSRDRRHDDRYRGGRDSNRDRDRDRDRDRGYYDSRGGRRDDSRYADRPSSRHGDRDRDRLDGSRRGESSRGKSPVRGGIRRPHDDDDYGNRPSNKRAKRDDSRNGETSRPSTANTAPVDEATLKAQLERQARIEVWKKKQLEKKALKSEENGPFPVAQSPAHVSQSTTAHDPPAAPVNEHKASSSPPRAKFDPKAIKKRTDAAMARAKSEKTTLGNDAAIPTTGLTNGTHASVAPTGLSNGATSLQSKDVKVTGFGLNKTAASDKSTTMTSASLDEEEGIKREFRKLPDAPHDSNLSDVALAHEQEQEEDIGDDLRSDEEEAEAAREAAQKRAEDAQVEEDTDMAGAAEPEAATANDHEPMDVDEDVDPLDAFMTNLDQAMEKPPPVRQTGKRANRELQLFDEDGPDLDAVGDNPEDVLNNPKRKKKEMPTVDHNKMEYEDIRKDFYSESIEVAEMTKEDVEKLRADLDNIEVRGIDPPKPITKWSQCGFGAQILDVIREQKFESPTSIQCQALPALMSGRDTIGIAKTGSGKTLAFVLPMFRHIKDQRPVANLEGPIGLIMAPTRELAVQIHRECKPYLKALNLRGVCAYGGAPIKDQIAELKRGAEVVVCTPGRMIDLLTANAGRVTNLRRVTYVVMDEADRMFDMGFGPQITKILDNVRPDRQTVTFSATFPKKMESLARKALNKPLEIMVGGRSVVAAEITQVIEVRDANTRFHRVLELLGDLYANDEDARTLIFVERQETADDMLLQLGKRGYPSVSVHGGREQIDRDQAILDFKAGVIPIMVATSVAARGLDVKQLKLVINYDAPNHGEDYVHRAGRTGRAGNTGTAVTFVTPDQERFAPFLVRALEDSKQEVPEPLKQMAVSHKKKVASGEATNVGSGFGGKGIEHLEAARAAERAWEKSQYKTGDEPDEEEDKEEKDKKSKSVTALVAKATGVIKDRDAGAEKSTESPSQGGMDKRLKEHLDNALKVQKGLDSQDPVARAAAAAKNINSRIGTKGAARPGAPTENRGPDAGAYHATLEMNDFPQKARWAVTNRTNVAKILDATNTSITSKGVYYPPGKEPQPGEQPKLYLLVEGDTEVAVAAAMRDLTRHLTEGTLAAQEADARPGAGGRYRVV